MNRHRALPLAFVALLVFGASQHIYAGRVGMPTAAAVTALRTSAPAAGGAFPDHWIDGTECDAEPDFQVHAYNEDFFIIRQSKCTILDEFVIHPVYKCGIFWNG